MISSTTEIPPRPRFLRAYWRGENRESLLLFFFLLHCGGSKRVDTLREEDRCPGVEVVTREGWRARPPWSDSRMKTPVNDVIIEHTATVQCFNREHCCRLVSSIQDYHMDYKGTGDIGYNFLIGGDGRAYEGAGWTRPGSHSFNFNTASMGVSFVGDFSGVEPSPKMIEAALALIECGVQKGHITPTREIHGHRDVICTKSPGDKLYAIIRKWKNYKGGRMPLYNC